MKSLKRSMIIIGLCCFVLLGSLPLYAADGIKTGTLVIEPVAGTRSNLIIRSTVDVVAVFTDNEGRKEHYVGEMGIGLGIDLSTKSNEKIGYIVISASSAYKTGSYAMQGKYHGAKADASLGVGVAAVVLVGGYEKSFTLQPAAVGTQTGWGAAAGASYLYLQKDVTK